MKHFWQWGLGIVMFLAVGTGVRAQQTLNGVPAELVTYPDQIIYNGKIVTMSDPTLSNSTGRTVSAMAIRGDRILAVGTDQEILRLAGQQTKKWDLKGRTVTPGLINTHTHLHDAAVNDWARRNPQKVEAVRKTFEVTGKTFADLTKGIELVIKEQMARPLPGQWAWITLPTGQSGSGIGIEYLMKNGMTRQQLDQLAPKLPVFVGAHPAFVWNTAARNAFLDWYEVEPTDANEKKAITIDTTMGRSLVADFYFDTHMDELADVIHDYLENQAVGGFTTFSSHIVGLRKMPAYTQLVRENRMPVRFAFANRYCQQVEVDIPGCFLRAGDYAGLGDENNYFWNVGITLGGIDNGPPAICTTMEAPPEIKAKEDCIIQPGNDYWRAVYSAIRSRYRYVVNHTWGDKGVDYVLDVIDQVMKENPSFTVDFVKSRRYSSDHCGFYPTPSQLPRMSRYGWMISCAANALTRSAPWLNVYQGDYAGRIAPLASAIKAGVMPTLEAELGLNASAGEEVTSMWLESLPFLTRKNRWGDPIAPQEAVDRQTLMKMATTWASRYVLKEKQIGSLEPGKLADFVVWNKDYFSVPEAELPTVYPLMTVLGGKTMMLREEYAREMGTSPVGLQGKFVFSEPVPEKPTREQLMSTEGAEG
ncbi:MAG TPA: amidohydrolase family protein [Terriglobia bacterium]|nr:amidohydrolase family protein [Terriglobia bacterium]